MTRETLQMLYKIEKSPLRDAYLLLNARSAVDLLKKFTDEDQILMKNGIWDYNNPDLVINKVKSILEDASDEGLYIGEKETKNEILWLWSHHAISCAIGKKDIEKAKYYAQEALKYQSYNSKNPNKITKLLFLLLNDKIIEAEDFANSIDGYEKETATYIINVCKNGWKGF